MATTLASKKAILRFDKETSRADLDAKWHRQTTVRKLPGGITELEVSYGEDRELIDEILRHGASCEVLAPRTLRKAVADQLSRAAQQYRAKR